MHSIAAENYGMRIITRELFAKNRTFFLNDEKDTLYDKT